MGQRRTIQYVVEISHDEEEHTFVEADVVFRERLRDCLSGVFPVHVGRVV
jgi:hypothetical protein